LAQQVLSDHIVMGMLRASNNFKQAGISIWPSTNGWVCDLPEQAEVAVNRDVAVAMKQALKLQAKWNKEGKKEGKKK
jgi:hypothetical protein